jgi:hypothetical protein
MGQRVYFIDRIGPVAKVTTIEFFGYFSNDREVEGGDFLGDGGVVATQIWIHSGFRCCAHIDIV